MPRGSAGIILSVCAYADFITGVELRGDGWVFCHLSDQTVDQESDLQQLSSVERQFGLISLWEPAEMSDEVL